MPRKQVRRLLIAGALVLAGTSGGVVLANFAMGGGTAQASAMPLSWPEEVHQEDAPVMASAGLEDGPRTYVCKGCGLTLAEQRAKEDADRYAAQSGYSAEDMAPLPPYRSSSQEGSDADRPLPVL